MAGSSESIPGNRERINATQVPRLVLELAERQWGVAAHWQLKKRGLSTSAIGRRSASGRLHRIYPGVYAVGHRALCTEGRLLAAILYAGPGAALSHASATHWWEPLPSLPHTTDVTSPRQRRSLPGVRVHRATTVERLIHRGLPVTPVARTLSPREDLLLALCRHRYSGVQLTGSRRAVAADIRRALHRAA